MNRPIHLAITAAALAGVSFAALAQAPTLAAITLQGAGPFYRLDLPITLYSHAAFDDLRDVRVRNAGGRAVPFTWLDAGLEAVAAPALKTATLRAPLFALPPAPSSATPGDDLLGFKVRSDGSLSMARVTAAPSSGNRAVAEWVIDASKAVGDLVQLRLELAPGAQGVFPFTLEGSNDMRQWRGITNEGQVVRLQHGGQAMEQLTVELDHVRARFLRLRWRDPAQAPALAGVWLDSDQALPTLAAPGAMEWTPAVPASACGVDYCDYTVPRGLPVHSLRIGLSEVNTLAPLRIFTLTPSGNPAEPARARRQSALHALGHGRAAATQNSTVAGPPETWLADTIVYRLNQPGLAITEVRSASVPMDGGVYANLRLRTRGPVAALGASPPTLSFGARPRTLAFLAQGNPPFALSWNAGAQKALDAAGPLTLAQFMPGYLPGRALSLDAASVALAMPVAAMPAAAATAAVIRAAPQAPVPTHRLWLWAALGAGLLLLGGMAWSLLRGLKNETPSA